MNAALLAEGEDEIVAENDGSNEWRLLSKQWPLIVEAEMEDSNLFFTRQQVQLLSRTDGKFGFEDAYAVPAAALHVRRVWIVVNDTRSELDWAQDGTNVYVDEDEGVWIEYIEAADVSFWGANFSRGVEMKLRAAILSFREDPRSADREQQAEVHFQRARTNSSKARSPTEPYRTGRFARARFRRG